MDAGDRVREAELIAALLGSRASGDYSEQTKEAAKLTLLDSIGVGLGTFDHPAVAAAYRYVDHYVPAASSARIWGTAKTSTAEGALVANTVPLRCYDFNDVLHGDAGQAGHPSDFVPGLVAVAEAERRDGAELLDAIVIAYDATKILFDVLNVSKGGWDYANLMGLGAVAGMASLLRLTEEQGTHALGIFASSHIGTNQLESGDLTSSGNLTMWKRFNGAEAVLAALRACHLASCGVEAPSNSLLGDLGLFRQLSPGRSYPTEVLEAVGQRRSSHGVELTEFKRWPVGTRAQSAITAALRCRDQLDGEAIESVTVEVESGVAKHLVRDEAWEPHSRETADHSLPFIVALALLYGDVTIDHFNSDRFFHDQAVRDLLTRIEISEVPDPETGRRSSFPARVLVRAQGREVSGTGEYPPAQIRAIPFRADLERKFNDLAGRRLPDDQVQQLRDVLMRIDELDDLTTLSALLALPDKEGGDATAPAPPVGEPAQVMASRPQW